MRPESSPAAGLAQELNVARPRRWIGKVGNDAAGPRRHDDHAVGQQDRLGDVVGDKDDRLAARHPDALQLDRHRLPGQCVKRRERLVHQQHAGVVQQRADNADALLHASGELIRVFLLEALQAGEREQLDGVARGLFARQVQDIGGKENVL